LIKSSLFLLIATILICCDNSKSNCKYYDGFKLYLSQVYDLDISAKDERIFYVLPLEGCDECLKINLNLLLERNFYSSKVTIILTGRNFNDIIKGQIEEIKRKYPILEDGKNLIHQFETGFGKPLLVHVKNGDCLFATSIADSEIESVKEYILDNS